MDAIKPLSVFIGYDSREAVASHVASHSVIKRTSFPVSVSYIDHREQRKRGNFARPWLIDGQSGELIDLIDSKKFSTEFSHTRFLVPKLMNYKGWALFMDSDMIFLSDIAKLFALCDDRYAVMCVKHNHRPAPNAMKMDGREQLSYFRKNWSSFTLWNCAHPANASLTPERVNYMKGAHLHQFCWIDDNLIGDLPFTYNYISGISPKLPPERGNRPDVIHYTEGGPWFSECQDVTYAKMWVEEYEDWQRNGDHEPFYSNVPSTVYEHPEVIRK